MPEGSSIGQYWNILIVPVFPIPGYSDMVALSDI